MNKITSLSLKNVGLIFIIMALVIAGGFYSVRSMKLEQYPNVEVPYLSFQVQYPGATPDQVADAIGKPMEEQLSGIEELENLYVTSSTNSLNVTLQFSMSASMEKATSAVNEAIAKVKLPDTAKALPVQKKGPSAQPIFLFAVDGGGANIEDIQAFTEEILKGKLQSVKGIADVEINGVPDKKVFIKLDPDKLKEYNLTVDKVKQAITASNLTAPTGEITINDKTMAVQTGKQFTSIEEIQNTHIAVVQQNTSALTDAFKGIGDGMSALGSAVGTLGKAVGTTAAQQQVLQQQLQASLGMSQLTMQLQADQVQLQTLLATNAKQPSEQTAAAIEGLQQKIAVEQTKLAELQGALAKLNEAAATLSATTQQTLQGMASAAPVKKPETSNSTQTSISISSVPLSTVADIRYDLVKQTSITRLNGHPAVVVGILPNNDANVVSVVEEAQRLLDETKLPDGYKLTTLRDESKDINHSVQSMMKEAIFGALLAALVTLLFLRNIRTTIISILSIPLSILITMGIMKTMGYSLNMMTLAGVAVAIGRVVDDSIVVIENLYRRIQLSKPEERNARFVLLATSEVSQAITSSTITTVAVFLPMAFVPGIVGKFFAPFAWSVVISIAFSLLVAVTVIPVLSKLFLLKLKPVAHKEALLERLYKYVLHWSLNHKLIIIAACVLLFAGSGMLVSKVPVNFFPAEKAKYYTVSTDLPIGTSIDKANEIATKVEEIVAATEAAANYQAVVSSTRSSIQVTLKEGAAAEKFEQAVREQTANLGEGIKTSLTASAGSPGGGGLSMIVIGSNLNEIQEAAAKYEEVIQGVAGVADVRSNLKQVRPQVSVQVDDTKATEKGIYPAAVAGTIRDMITGTAVTNITLNGKTTEVNLGLQTEQLTSLEAIGEQKLTSAAGDDIAIKEIATIQETTGPTSIQRRNKQDYVSISGKFTSSNSQQIQKDIKAAVEKVAVADGISYYFEGEAKQINEGFQNMFLAIGVSVLLVYFIMMLTFGEMLAPFAIMFSLPFIFIGVIAGLILTGESLGMPALVGVLMLIGIVVTNAIVLVDRVKQNEARGMSTYDSLIEAGMNRIRPILMTAIATIGALIPLALSTEGGLISKSLAIVVISGLTVSTALTLVIVPIVYLFLQNMRSRFTKNKEKVEDFSSTSSL